MLSVHRIAPYRLDKADDSPVQLYAWNISLSEALYPPFAVLEVCLRNSLDAGQGGGSGTWKPPLLIDTPEFLRVNERDHLATSITFVIRSRREVPHERLVAELPFSFWTALLNRPYEGTLWPASLRSVFPLAPRRQRVRSKLADKLNNDPEAASPGFPP